ncbi:MAG: GTP 3',8-cyclase MoaA [Saccharofermentanales bacterium]
MYDSFQRKIEYLRLSITDSCNLKCTYCKKSDARRKQLELAEIACLLPAFRETGINKIRITGGEPLLHPDILEIIRLCSESGFEDISMTTNALLLEEKAQDLKDNGLHRINISMNSLSDENYFEITGIHGLGKVRAGIAAAEKAGLYPIKINVVLMKGKNDQEISDFIQLTKVASYQVRFIEYMPMGAEMEASSIRITQSEILSLHPELIKQKEDDTSSAQIFRVNGYAGNIGFISPVSQPFCHDCTRVRVTSALTLRPCLGNNDEVDLRVPIADGTLIKIIKQTIGQKPHQGFCPGFETIRPMSEIGG